jgi:sulfatase modifying factor 1
MRVSGCLAYFAVAFVLIGSLSVAHGQTGKGVLLFVEDVEIGALPDWDAEQRATLSRALASDIQAIIARDQRYLPMTFENLEMQLKKEKKLQQLTCERLDQKCLLRILDNYGCEERVFASVRPLGKQVQVSFSRFRGSELVPGGADSAYTESNVSAISTAIRQLAGRMFGVGPQTPYSPDSPSAPPSRPAAAPPPQTILQQLVSIPGGEFVMGSRAGERPERREHTVVLSPFKIDRYETTQAMFARYLSATRRAAPTCFWDPNAMPNHPAVCVRWWDAKAYCEWTGGRLPTEAEWEMAARGKDRRLYPWGFEPAGCSRAIMEGGTNQAGCGANFAQPVGSRPQGASPFGVQDMSGNASEWVADFFDDDYYGDSPTSNPKGPSRGSLRVIRGGSWGDNMPRYLTATQRARKIPEEANKYVGFRCVRDAK